MAEETSVHIVLALSIGAARQLSIAEENSYTRDKNQIQIDATVNHQEPNNPRYTGIDQ